MEYDVAGKAAIEGINSKVISNEVDEELTTLFISRAKDSAVAEEITAVEKAAVINSAKQFESKVLIDNIPHIFTSEPGHLLDTPINRALLNDTVSSAKNLLGTDKFGNNWHGKILSDGKQAWTSSRDGIIRNGGLNGTPKTFDPETGLCAPRIQRN